MKKSWYTPLVGLATIVLIVFLFSAVLTLPGLAMMHFIKPPSDMNTPMQRSMFAVFLTLGSGGALYGAYRITRGFYNMTLGVGEAVLEYWSLWRENRK